MEATLESLQGQIDSSIGVSDWLKLEQSDVDAFGRSTFDVEPLHMDPEWCERNSPYGQPIAYGFQTIGLLTCLFHQSTGDLFSGSEGSKNFPLNYGFDRLRLLSPVKVGSEIRGQFVLRGVQEKRPGELLLRIDVTVEMRGVNRPALIAEWLVMFVTKGGRKSVVRTAK